MQAAAVSTPMSMVASNTEARQHKLTQAAHEFEAQMMKELLKPLQEMGELGGEDGGLDGGAGAEGALGEFAQEALGQALSRSGGFGIADRLLHTLSASGKTAGNGNAQAHVEGNKAIRGH